MKPAIYKITTASGVMYASANLTEASAPIHAYFGKDPLFDEGGSERCDNEGNRWNSTPFQTADTKR